MGSSWRVSVRCLSKGSTFSNPCWRLSRAWKRNRASSWRSYGGSTLTHNPRDERTTMDMPPDDLNRLTLLERAQFLHDVTLRRHGELLDRHEDSRIQHEENMRVLREIQERQERTMETLTTLVSQHDERMRELHQTLEAIKDLLNRR